MPLSANPWGCVPGIQLLLYCGLELGGSSWRSPERLVDRGWGFGGLGLRTLVSLQTLCVTLGKSLLLSGPRLALL